MGLQIKLKAHGKKVCRINIKYTRDKSVLNMNRHRTYGWVSETTQVLPTLHLFGSVFFLSFCLSLHVIIHFMIFASTRKYVSYFEMPAAGAFAASTTHNFSPCRSISDFVVSPHNAFEYAVPMFRVFIHLFRRYVKFLLAHLWICQGLVYLWKMYAISPPHRSSILVKIERKHSPGK